MSLLVSVCRTLRPEPSTSFLRKLFRICPEEVEVTRFLNFKSFLNNFYLANIRSNNVIFLLLILCCSKDRGARKWRYVCTNDKMILIVLCIWAVWRIRIILIRIRIQDLNKFFTNPDSDRTFIQIQIQAKKDSVPVKSKNLIKMLIFHDLWVNIT